MATTTPGAWWRLYGIFFQPGQTLEAIRHSPNWFLPLLLAVIVSTLSSTVFLELVGIENILRQQLETNPEVRNLPPDQLEQTIESVTGSPAFTAVFYLSSPVGTALMVLIAAAALLAVVALQGKRTSFKKVLSLSAHGFFLYSTIYSALILLVLLLSEDPTKTDIQNPVSSNPGFWVDRLESPALFSLASSLDLISIYALILFGWGLSVVTESLSMKAGLLSVAFLWLLYVVGKTGLTAAFS